jgi:inward rectifier potassium channel
VRGRGADRPLRQEPGAVQGAAPHRVRSRRRRQLVIVAGIEPKTVTIPEQDRPRTFQERVVRAGLRRKPLSDLYHLLLTISWWRLFTLLIIGYVGANAVFASLYMLDPAGLENARPHDFFDHFFFSVQTMATIGYGKMTPVSVYANVLVTIEALIGLLSMAMATGLMFAKFSRPTARVLFSRVLIVNRRDGVPSLMLRMANQRGNQIVEANLRLTLLRDEVTAEGEPVRRMHDLKLSRPSTAVFALTWTAWHPITPDSPLYGIDEKAYRESRANILASVIGIDETFNQTVNARYTWLSDEVLYGARFVDVLSPLPDGRSVIDYAKFHDIILPAKSEGTAA